MMAETVGVGSEVPDLTLPTLDGAEFAFRDRRGKRLLLFFWGSW